MTADKLLVLECPACGDIAALPDADGYYVDGQPLTCGCRGHISCDTETEPCVCVEWGDDA